MIKVNFLYKGVYRTASCFTEAEIGYELASQAIKQGAAKLVTVEGLSKPVHAVIVPPRWAYVSDKGQHLAVIDERAFRFLKTRMELEK